MDVFKKTQPATAAIIFAFISNPNESINSEMFK